MLVNSEITERTISQQVNDFQLFFETELLGGLEWSGLFPSNLCQNPNRHAEMPAKENTDEGLPSN